MRQIPNYADERLFSCCAYCGGPAESKDHVVSKALLDEPYPEQLPTVWACVPCNNGYSFAEAYLACIVECARLGTTVEDDIEREKVRRIMRDYPTIRESIVSSRSERGGRLFWTPDAALLCAALTKLGRGHALFDLAESIDDPQITYVPLCEMSRRDRERFETPPSMECAPEVGSRTMLAFWEGGLRYRWITVQRGRYRYCASPQCVRIVLSDYLAVEVCTG